jgi:hypothetical protein
VPPFRNASHEFDFCMSRDPLPKHLRPGDLRPHPRLNEVEGYLPSPASSNSGSSHPGGSSLEGGSEKPPPSTSAEVQTTPSDWADPDGRTGPSKPPNTEPSNSESSTNESSTSDEPMTAEELVEKAVEEGPAVVFEHIEVLARASEAEYQKARARLKAETGINLNALASARREAKGRLNERQKTEKRRELEDEDIPFIQVDANRPSRELVDEACSALEAFNDPPEVFRRGEEMVRARSPEGERPSFEVVEKAGFDDLLSRSANFAKETEEDFEHTDLPRRQVNKVRNRVDIPHLKSVSQVPVLRPDGSVFRGPGYDEETEVLCRPGPAGPVPPVPERPTSADVRQAADMLREPFVDFPFVNQASRANLLAALLTPILRPLLDGANVPLMILNAPKQGTGKSLLTDIVGLISAGRKPPNMSAPTSEPEWRKQITAQLRSGEPVITIDNVKGGRISSSALERALTAERYGDRILNQSRQVELPADVLWVATGNNLRPEGEMTRRCVRVRIDAEMVHPWTRTEFEHPDLEGWVRANRGELVAAGLTLVRGWINDGRPMPEDVQLGSFERWAAVAGGVLQTAGIEGFLDNLDDLYDTAGQEERRWRRLLAAIHQWAQEESPDGGAQEGDASKMDDPNRDAHSPATFTAKELAGDLESAEDPTSDSLTNDRSTGDSSTGDDSPGEVLRKIQGALPDALKDRLRKGKPVARSLGKRLGNRKKYRFPGGWHVRREGQGRKGTRWAVCREKSSDQNPPSQNPPKQNPTSQNVPEQEDASSEGEASTDTPSTETPFTDTPSPDRTSPDRPSPDRSSANKPPADRPARPGREGATQGGSPPTEPA